MFKFLKRWLASWQGPEIRVLERSPSQNPLLKDPEAKASVRSLQAHPGFQYLLAKLNLQGDVLRSSLAHDRHTSLRDVEFIQSGIFWTGWLETQIKHELYAQISQEIPGRTVDLDELQALKDQSTIRLLGVSQ